MAAQSRDKRTIEQDKRKRGRVLLITDDPASAPAQALEAIGLEIVGVAGGTAAMVSLQRSRPQVAIASAKVKGISTGELARMLGQTQERLPLWSRV